jgi:hypothetical protein
MKFTKPAQFTKHNVNEVRVLVQTALDQLAKETGLTLKACGGGTFGNATFRFPIEVDLNIGGMSDTDRSFNEHAKSYRLTEKVGDVITRNGTDYKIVGWNGRSRSYPIMAVRVSDQQEFGLALTSMPSATVSPDGGVMVFAAGK